MATVTTDFIAPSAPRSRAERSSEGVIAAYIRSLAQMVKLEPESVEQDTDKPGPAWRCNGRTRRGARMSLLAEAR